jgi:YVTN family beta-propeller protein
VTSISLQNVSAGILSGLGIDSLNGDIYLSSRGGTLVALSGANNSVVASRSLGSYPSGIAFDPSSDELFVADSREQALYAIAPEGLGLLSAVPFLNASQPVVNDWWPIDVPALGSVFVPEGTTTIVAGVDAAAGTLFAVLDTDASPDAEAWDPGCTCLVVGLPNLDRLYFVNVSRLQVESFAPLPGTPSSLLYLAATNELEVSMQGEFTGSQGLALLNASDGLLVVENSAVAYPANAAFDPSSGTLFLPEEAAQAIAWVSAANGSVLFTAPVGLDPTAAVFAPGPNEVFVANQVSNNVTVLNATSGAELGAIALGTSPESLAVDGGADRLYVGTGLNVSFFDLRDSAAFVGSLAVASANTIVLDPSNATAYFTNETDDVIEVSLSSGAVTEVAAGGMLRGLVELATGALVAIDPIDGGIYDVAAAPSDYIYNASFSATPYVAATGGAVSFQIAAPAALGPFQVDYSGLPAGCMSADVTLLPCAPLGTGTYQIGAVLTEPAGQTISRSLRLWMLAGGFDVTVNETGLPAGTPWWFNVSAGAAYASEGRQLTLPLLDGNYSYSLGTTDAGWRAPPGAFQVANAETWLPVLFAEPTFTVTISEYGLPAGTSWAIAIGSLPAASSTVALQRFSLANGTYFFNASALNATGWRSSDGSFSVQGAALGVSVRFAPLVPVIASFTAVPSILLIGGTIRLSVNASAGAAPLTFTYANLPGGCSSANETPLLCAPNVTGPYTISVQFRSSAGGSAVANTSVEVQPSSGGSAPAPPCSTPRSSWGWGSSPPRSWPRSSCSAVADAVPPPQNRPRSGPVVATESARALHRRAVDRGSAALPAGNGAVRI